MSAPDRKATVQAKLDADTAKRLDSKQLILCPESLVGENHMGSMPYFPSSIFDDAGKYADAYFDLCAAAAATVGRDALAKAGRVLAERAAAGALIFSCGNGGSAAIANHLVCDCMKGVRTGSSLKPKITSLSTTVELMTAIVNDIGPAEMFAHQLSSLASPGDVLITISSSGASPNIIRALETARAMQLTTIAMTGFSGGEAAELADITLHVDAQNYGIVEDVHQSLMHIMAQYLRHSHLDDPSSLGSVKF